MLYLHFKDFPTQIFVITGNGDNVISKLNDLFKEDNLKVTNDGFYSNQNIMAYDLNQMSKTFQRQKSQKSNFKTNMNENTSV